MIISQVLKSISNPTKMLKSSKYNYLKLPAICALCNQYYRNSHGICSACMTLIKPIEKSCRICAIPVPDQNDSLCGACCIKKPEVNRIITAYSFEEPLRTLLHSFKYHNSLYLTSLLIELMLDAPYDKNNMQCLMPIPIHPKRLRERGFNQAAILAMNLSKKINIPYDLYLCEKIRNTYPQAKLNATLRNNNLKNAFKARPMSFEHVTLIDDLVTTGNTACEVAMVLKNQGVKTVDVWCCARAVSRISR